MAKLMSWELASFVILAAVLLGGFAWYERSRPPAQTVALVAALAALAIAGRIAFAAFPNVKPTTDIVIVAGYALGAAPGFAVGALTALVSNFWFGQGPWTPWQMAGWGMCGVLGAALAVIRPRPGRLTLAVVCGLAGLAYGALLNFSLMATYGGDLSMERFLALQSRAVPFDLAHAIGNFVLAFVAGPAMVRMLTRFRERFEWRTPAVATTVLLTLLVAASLPSSAKAEGSADAARWLISEQNTDGGWGASPDDESAPEITAWAMLGLEATGHNPLDLSQGSANPVSYLRANVARLESPGDLARTILALHGAGVDPRSFGGRDLVSALVKKRRSNGSYEGWPGTTAFAVIALRAAGADGSLDSSISWLSKVQDKDGGWGDTPDSPSTADGTGAAMQAMPNTEDAQQGLGFLRRAQRPNGGFALGGTGAVNAQSTAWAVQGMLAVGADPAKPASGDKSALDYLAARQAPDGHYQYSDSSDQTPIWVTGQVLAAVAGKPFPLTPVPRKTTPASPGTGTVPIPTTPPPSTGGSAQSLLESLEGSGGGSGATPAPPSTEVNPSVPPPAAGTGPGSTPKPPAGTVPEGDEPEPAPAESAAQPFEASAPPAPNPAVPVGIGLASSGLALGGVLFLGRRFGW